MAWEYRLTKLFPNGEAFRVNHKNGEMVRTSLIRFDYGKTYTTEDEVLANSLKSLGGKYPKNQTNKTWLDRLGVAYDEAPCQSCGGRVVKYHVPYFEVKEV